jgi:hypothetical protein
MQFGFMPGRSTTDAIFILRQLQEKHLSRHKKLYFAFIDLEKAFDRVPRSVLWWSMRSLGVEEWVIRLVKTLYDGATSCVRINGSYSENFDITVGVHQGSVLSPLLFAIVMEALSRECRVGCPWEILYADDLVIMSDNIIDLKRQLEAWKTSLESRGLRVNVNKTKVLCSGWEAPRPIKQNVKWPCGVCSAGVGSNSIQCQNCNLWVHKRCSGIRGALHRNTHFTCRKCNGEIIVPVQLNPYPVSTGNDVFESVTKFKYLGDVIGEAGGCDDAITTRITAAWNAFRLLLPILTNRSISLRNRGHVFNTCVRKVLLYGSETWPISCEHTRRLVTADSGMIRWMCHTSLADRIPTSVLLDNLALNSIQAELRANRLRYYGHLHRMDDQLWPKQILNFNVEGTIPRGRPKLRWSDVINKDLKILGISNQLANDRVRWRAAIRPNDDATQKECNPR